MTLYHATCVAIDGKGVLLHGPSGSGKSDLALRLLGLGAKLVGDDYVKLTKRKDRLTASAPENIAGKIEVRGVGLVDMDFTKTADIALHIDLKSRADIPRLPDPETIELDGVLIPSVTLHAFDASTPDKIALILKTTLKD